MIYNLYGDRQVNDANMGCHTVLVSECDGMHVYKTVCELVKECLPEGQLKNPCVVDFLNSNLKPRTGEFLKIAPNGCITTGPVECPCDDRNVAATEQDTNPGPLIKKLVGGCDPSGTYCISVGSPSPNVVQVLPSGPVNGFTKFEGKADCDDAIVKMDTAGRVYTECPEIKQGLRYAQCKHSGGYADFPWNHTDRIYAVIGGSSSATFNFAGTWGIKATPGFSVGGDLALINIEESGLYHFTYECYVTWSNPYIYAIRAGIWVGDTELGDVKYNGGTWVAEDWDSWPVNPRFPNSQDNSKDRHRNRMLELDGLSFSGSFVLPVTNVSKANPAPVRFSVKPDTRCSDPRYIDTKQNTRIYLTDSTQTWGPQTVITITKVDEDPRMYGYKTLI